MTIWPPNYTRSFLHPTLKEWKAKIKATTRRQKVPLKTWLNNTDQFAFKTGTPSRTWPRKMNYDFLSLRWQWNPLQHNTTETLMAHLREVRDHARCGNPCTYGCFNHPKKINTDLTYELLSNSGDFFLFQPWRSSRTTNPEKTDGKSSITFFSNEKPTV